MGPSWGQWGQKMGQNRKNSNFPNFQIFQVISGAKSRWGLPRAHRGPMGPHWGKKSVTNVKVPILKNSNFSLPRGQKMAPNHDGDPLEPIIGQWRPIGTNRWVKTVKIPIFQKFQFFTTPRSKNASYGAKSRWAHLGANGDPNGAKRWAKTVKIPIFQMFKFSKRFMEPNHGGDSLGPIVGPMGPNWGKSVTTVTIPIFKNSNFALPRGQKMAPNHDWDPLEPILGQWGPIGTKRWVKTVKIPIFQKFQFFLQRRG